MVEMKEQSHWWWFEGHNSPHRSPWLQSTLTELDEKTKAMLKLIEEDADSFRQRAEMYYKKRPELINMVEDFYRAHRSLAERFDLVKQDSGPRLLTTLGSPFSLNKNRPMKLTNMVDQSYDSYSETFDYEESGESEVDDPDQEDEIREDEELEEEDVSSEAAAIANEEVMNLREEMEKLKEENKMQKDQLMQKDEEKREVIRQLSLAVEMLKDENVKLRRKCIARECPKKRSPLEFHKLEGCFWGSCLVMGSVVAL